MSENAQTLPALTSEKAGEIMEAVIARGDLAQLNPQERAKYYTRVCESIGLNPLTKPFEYITLNGKLTLYARKDTTDQLRTIHNVSVIEMTEAERDGLVIVTVKVRNGQGRTDMAKGAVSLKGLQGEALANAFMKAETKAKRRATLSICGLGFLNEIEVETIPEAKRSRLPKKDARDIYKRLQSEVDLISIRADFDQWCEENEQRIAVLPEDWEEILRLRIQERRVDIQRDEAPPVVWDEDTIPDLDSDWEKLGPVKQAGILCGDESFWKFINKTTRSRGTTAKSDPIHSEEDAAQYVRSFCDVESRSELATNPEAAKLWRKLVEDYRAWQREPSVIEESPHQIKPLDAMTDAAPAETPGKQTGAAEVHEDEIERLARVETILSEAADIGTAALQAVWKNMSPADQKVFEAAKNRRFKPAAEEADRVRV